MSCMKFQQVSARAGFCNSGMPFHRKQAGATTGLTREVFDWARLCHPHCRDATKLGCMHEGSGASRAVAHEACRISIAERPHIVYCCLNILNTCNSMWCLPEHMGVISFLIQVVLPLSLAASLAVYPGTSSTPQLAPATPSQTSPEQLGAKPTKLMALACQRC